MQKGSAESVAHRNGRGLSCSCNRTVMRASAIRDLMKAAQHTDGPDAASKAKQRVHPHRGSSNRLTWKEKSVLA